MTSNGLKLPTIDFSNHQELKPNTPLWESTKIQVIEALQEYGCFEAIIPNEIREGMFGTANELFEFPLETKLKNLSETRMHGYFGSSPELPLYESLCIDDLLNPQCVETFANIFWPNGTLDFCNLVNSYTNPLVELDGMVKRMTLEKLGLNNYIDDLLNSNKIQVRFTHYKAPPINSGGESNKATGLDGHTDYNFLTIITENQVNGLQIQNKNGEWFDVNTSPNSCVVLSGDSFMAWTNGRLHSPVHRVTMAGENDRFSIQLFSSLIPNKPGQCIEPPKELVDEEHPLLFKPFGTQEFGEFIVAKDVGDRAGAFKAHFGV